MSLMKLRLVENTEAHEKQLLLHEYILLRCTAAVWHTRKTSSSSGSSMDSPCHSVPEAIYKIVQPGWVAMDQDD